MSEKNISRRSGKRPKSSKTSGIPMAIRENAEGVSLERSVEGVAHGPTNSLESTWPKNPLAFMSRFKPFFRFRNSLTFKFSGDLARAFNRRILQPKETRSDLERKAEERTHQLEEKIAELNRARTTTLKILEELQAAKRELEMVKREFKEMDETRMKFIGIASHELKTPLTAIKANIDFILSEKEGSVPENLKSYLITIQRNTNRIQMRMDQMLDLSRIKSDRLLFNREQIRLSELIAGYINEATPVDKSLSIQVDIAPDLYLYADRNAL